MPYEKYQYPSSNIVSHGANNLGTARYTRRIDVECARGMCVVFKAQSPQQKCLIKYVKHAVWLVLSQKGGLEKRFILWKGGNNDGHGDAVHATFVILHVQPCYRCVEVGGSFVGHVCEIPLQQFIYTQISSLVIDDDCPGVKYYTRYCTAVIFLNTHTSMVS